MDRPFTSDRRFVFPVPPGELWERMTAVGEFRTWWPWLRRLDATGVVAGDEWACVVQPPLPYTVRFTVAIAHVEVGQRIDATVSGDIRGSASLFVSPDGDESASVARLVSSLEPAHHALRLFGRVARPMVQWGHDWVLDQGLRQFHDRALPR